jgi:glycosyltransferase involved in cell wall biosynthesis
MYNGKKIVVVMPAYNAAKTVTQTVDEVHQQGIVDLIILVDDRSRDDTVQVASQLLGVKVHVHEKNTGYGGNQKTCYRLALEAGADIVIMVHPDYQYTPKLIPAMASMIANDLHPCVLGSRILGGYSLMGGMPWWKFIANRFLTAAENILIGAKLSEYHTGYRAIPTTSCSTTRCSRKFSGMDLRLAKSVAPRNISPKPRPSISSAVANTDSAASAPA